MAIILLSAMCQLALVYLEDVLIFLQALKDHKTHAQTVFTLLRNAGVSLKIQKRLFFMSIIDYLGHQIPLGRLMISNRKRQAIERLRTSKDDIEFRSSLGFCNVYRRFVQHFPQI